MKEEYKERLVIMKKEAEEALRRQDYNYSCMELSCSNKYIDVRVVVCENNTNGYKEEVRMWMDTLEPKIKELLDFVDETV